VTDLDRTVVLSALEAGYENLTAAVSGLGDAEMMRPSRCAGWAVADVLYHQLLDARRALRAFATPSASPADRDYVSYWREFSPSGNSDFAPESDGSAAHARHVRIVASAYPPGMLAWEWSETSRAACRAARACPHEAVETQGHVLTTVDFVATLVVEAAVHYLDVTLRLAGAPPPDQASLRLVREVLAGLLGERLPADWDDVTSALKGTGREPLSEDDLRRLGSLAARFPLFG